MKIQYFFQLKYSLKAISMDSTSIEPSGGAVSEVPRDNIASAGNPGERSDRAFMLNNSLNVDALVGAETAGSLAGGWSKQNTDTIEGWKRDLELMAYIYTTCKERFIGYIQNVLVATLVISAIAAAISAISVTLGGSFVGAGTDYKTAILVLNIIVLVGTGITTVANGLIKIYSWDTCSVQYNEFVGRVGALWTTIDSELNMPPDQRAPAADFMKRVYGQYTMLKQLAPGIASAVVNNAHRQYQNAAYDNYVWENQFAQKFRVASASV